MAEALAAGGVAPAPGLTLGGRRRRGRPLAGEEGSPPPIGRGSARGLPADGVAGRRGAEWLSAWPPGRRSGRGNGAVPRCAGRAGRGAAPRPPRWGTASRPANAPRGRRRSGRKKIPSGTTTTSRRTTWRRSTRSLRRRCRRTPPDEARPQRAACTARGAAPRSPEVSAGRGGGGGATVAIARPQLSRSLSAAGGGADGAQLRGAFQLQVLQAQHEDARRKVSAAPQLCGARGRGSGPASDPGGSESERAVYERSPNGNGSRASEGSGVCAPGISDKQMLICQFLSFLLNPLSCAAALCHSMI